MPLARDSSSDKSADFKPLYLGFDLSTQQLKGTSNAQQHARNTIG